MMTLMVSNGWLMAQMATPPIAPATKSARPPADPDPVEPKGFNDLAGLSGSLGGADGLNSGILSAG
jgi:hypothetical protein